MLRFIEESEMNRRKISFRAKRSRYDENRLVARENDPICRSALGSKNATQNLGEVVGQSHILAEGNLLPKLAKSNSFGSLLFYGPPDAGKPALRRP